jgi:hypothetical protein
MTTFSQTLAPLANVASDWVAALRTSRKTSVAHLHTAPACRDRSGPGHTGFPRCPRCSDRRCDRIRRPVPFARRKTRPNLLCAALSHKQPEHRCWIAPGRNPSLGPPIRTLRAARYGSVGIAISSRWSASIGSAVSVPGSSRAVSVSRLHAGACRSILATWTRNARPPSIDIRRRRKQR